MYETIITQIKTILESVKTVKSIYAYPLQGSPKTYPAVVFIPDTVENVYSTSSENKKKYKFKMWIEVDIAGTDVETVFSSVLPKVVDEVINAFDAGWSQTIDNHRAWLVIDSGLWGLSEENKSLKAFTELSLTYEVSNDI